MIQNEALFGSILATPDDDAPRLIYADWLEEQREEERAEFIRVQCSLAKMTSTDPQRPALQQRERELLNQYGWAWAEHLSPQVRQWQFRRGFVERVEMGLETSRDNILAVLAKSPIRHIRDTSQFCDLSGVVAALPRFKHLTGLEFWGLYAFDDRLLEKILTSRHLKNLQTLILHHDRNGNMANDKMLCEAVQLPVRKAIRELAINIDGSWRGPSRKLLQAMALSPYLRNLRHLSIDHAGDEGNEPMMDLKTIRAIGQSPNFAGLKELDLGNASFSLPCWEAVLKWPFLGQLDWLRLHYARQVNPPEALTVAEIANVPAIRQPLEAKVKHIDWDSMFITPWDGNSNWQGLSWDGLRQQHLFAMWPFIERADFKGLEQTYHDDCVKHAGPEAAEVIAKLNFKKYQAALTTDYTRIVNASRRRRGVKSIYFRLRPDLQWSGEFHASPEESPEPFEPRQEYSYTGPIVEYATADFPAASDLRDRFPAQSPLDPLASLHYLLARTVATFARVVAKEKAPVPVFFSCMYAVFKMFQPAEKGKK